MHRTLATSVLAACLVACSGASEAPAEGTSAARDSRPLLERAIDAHGGAERLLAIRTIRTVSITRERGRERRVTTLAERPGRYRFETDTGLATIVIAQDGAQLWRSLEGLRTEPDRGDAKIVAQDLLRLEMALLAGLRQHEDLDLRERGVRDGLEWLELRFRAEGYGPFRLGFAPDTALLSRMEYEEQLPGADRPLSLVLELADYREVDGVRTAWKGVFRHGETVLVSNEVQEIAFNEELPSSAFAMAGNSNDPLPQLGSIHLRDCPELHVAELELGDRRPSDAERRLEAWMQEHKLLRAGPLLQRLEGGIVRAVAIPVAVPEESKAAAPADNGSEPRLVHWPRGRFASRAMALKDDPEPTELRAALAALRREEPRAMADSARIVRWPGDLIQIQVPLAP